MAVSVKICSGTACYIMGGADLLSIENDLSLEEREMVKIEASTCLGICNDYGPNTPYVMVDGEMLSRATRETLLDRIRQAIASEEGSND